MSATVTNLVAVRLACDVRYLTDEKCPEVFEQTASQKWQVMSEAHEAGWRAIRHVALGEQEPHGNVVYVCPAHSESALR